MGVDRIHLQAVYRRDALEALFPYVNLHGVQSLLFGEVLITCFFTTVFGIFSLFDSSRHKECMAMIERRLTRLPREVVPRTYHLLVILLLNLAVLLIAVGSSVFMGAVLRHHLKVDTGIVYPLTIFLM